MTYIHLTSYVAEKRAAGIPWDHIANMAGCASADLQAFRDLDARGALPKPELVPAQMVDAAPPVMAATAPQSRPKATKRPRKTNRREPGGLLLAVLFAVGDGYSTSLRIAGLLDTSIDNVNGALGRLEAAGHIDRASYPDVSPVVWMATEQGMAHLRCQMAEGFD